jgi:glycerophosphoryl diester phosphodiesterase
MKRILLLALLYTGAQNTTAAPQQAAQTSKVMVASHRGDWRNYADNSLEGIQSCILMGVDMVEIDLAMTKDSVLVLMHDRKVDRTTNAKGAVSDYTLAEIRNMSLRNGLGRVTHFKIPTLEEVMRATKGKIRLNLDKSDQYFDKVYSILRTTGTLNEAVIKSDKPYAQLRERYGALLDSMTFMQIIILKPETTIDSIGAALDQHFPYYEVIFAEANTALLLQIKARLQGTSSVIWINSLWDSLCGGYSDDKALQNPDETWGYLIDTLGAGVLQTDRPALMLEYLRQRKQHE